MDPREVILQRVEQIGRHVGPPLHIPLHTHIPTSDLEVNDRVEIVNAHVGGQAYIGKQGTVLGRDSEVVHVKVDGALENSVMFRRDNVQKIEQPYEVGDEVEVFDDPNFSGIRGTVHAIHPNGQATIIQSEKWRGFDKGQSLMFPRRNLRKVEPKPTATEFLNSQDTEFVHRLVELAEVLSSDERQLVLQQEMIDALNECKKDIALLDELRDLEAKLERALNHPHGTPRKLATMEVISAAKAFAKKTDTRPLHNDVDRLLRRAITRGLGTHAASDTQLDRLVASLLGDTATNIVVTMEFPDVLTEDQMREVAKAIQDHDPHVVRTEVKSLEDTIIFDKRR